MGVVAHGVADVVSEKIVVGGTPQCCGASESERIRRFWPDPNPKKFGFGFGYRYCFKLKIISKNQR
jgi:hypothetical protein